MRQIAAKNRDRMKSWLDRQLDDHGAKILVILIGLLIVVPAAITWRYLSTTASVADEAKSAAVEAKRASRTSRLLGERIETGLIEGCRRNGNTVRRILRRRIHKEVVQSAKIAPELFPQFPPKRLEALIARSNERALAEARELHPIDCRAQYAAR